MASFTERIRLVFDVDNRQATTGIGGIRNAVRDAEGFTGKFRAGMSSAVGSIGDFVRSGPGMVTVAGAAGAALLSFADKAQQLALKVGKLSEATGMSTESASRWVEVAGDVGVEADKLAGLVQKLTRNLGATPDKFAALGVEIQHAKDGSVDMNATLLDAIGVLNKTTDPTKRAALAQQLFGKAWADAAELIGMSADDLSKRLGEVSDAKIISPDDVKRAREYRDSMDKLSDVGEDLAITLGKAVLPVLTATADAVGWLSDTAESADDAIGTLSGGVLGLGDAALVALGPVGWLIESLRLLDELSTDYWKNSSKAIIEFETAQKAAAEAADTTSDSIDRLAREKLHELEKAEKDAAREAGNLAMKLGDTKRAVKDLRDEISDRKEYADIRLALVGWRDDLVELDRQLAAGEISQAVYGLKVQSIMDESKLRVLDYAATVKNIPAEVVARITAEVDPRFQGAVNQALLSLKQIKDLGLTFTAGGMLYGSGMRNAMEGRAKGGPVRAGAAYVVGENGPEVLQMGGTDGRIVPNGSLGGGTYNITVNAHPTNNPAEVGHAVADALKAAARQGAINPWE